jgi:hypothetical protein
MFENVGVDVGNTKTTERGGGVNQLFMSLNNFIPFKIIYLPSSNHQQYTTYGQ